MAIELIWTGAVTTPILAVLLLAYVGRLHPMAIVNLIRQTFDLPAPVKEIVQENSLHRLTLQSNRGSCPVCGETLSGRRVILCRCCLTPHHCECFDWNRGCGVYACGSPAFLYQTKKTIR